MDAKVGSKFMRESGEFSKDEFLTWQQISAFWSREAQKRERQDIADDEDIDVCADAFYRVERSCKKSEDRVKRSCKKN